MPSFRRLSPLSCVVALVLSVSALRADETWKAGTARADITPKQPQWMAGYGGRDHPAEGTLHPLYIRVLALEDARGHRAVVLTSDLLGIPQSVYRNTTERLERKFGLKRDQVMLHASHSHCTPVLRNALYDAYPLPAAQRPVIEQFVAPVRGRRGVVDLMAEITDPIPNAVISRMCWDRSMPLPNTSPDMSPTPTHVKCWDWV